MADPAVLDEVRAVLNAHKHELISTYGAEGAGIGAAPGGREGYALVVYVSTKQQRPETEVTVDGVPVRFEVTGIFRPLAERSE